MRTRHLTDNRVDLFLCNWYGRTAWLKQCANFWNGVTGLGKVHILTPPAGFTGAMFQKWRRVEADRLGGEFYILSDDDCLPESRDVITVGLSVLKAHPWFSIVSLLPQNANIVEWTPEGYNVKSDADILEHVSVGGVRFCRKMPFTHWPDMPAHYRGYDAQHSQAIRDAGFRVGYFRNLKMTHLGEGQTTLLEMTA